MEAARVFREEYEVSRQLSLFSVTKDELIDVVRAAVAGKADAIENDPIWAANSFANSYGTRALRQLFRSKGWELDREDNLESVYDPATGIKIVFQNADNACNDAKGPRAIQGKGPAAIRAIDNGQGSLFPEIEEAEEIRDNATIWYLFVYINKDDVRAELSWPKPISAQQFIAFRERIFLIQKGEWGTVAPIVDISGDDLLDFEVNVTRK